jgi:uncharacterized protein (TIGR00375 family)
MRFFADFHVHSKYSIATSQSCCPELLDLWARKKGITVLGTADALHPEWYRELKNKMLHCDNGLYKLRDECIHHDHKLYFGREVYFLVTTEVCCIYKWDNKVRRIHHLIMLSSLDSAYKLKKRLEYFGNLSADGRPCLKIDSRDLLELTLSIDQKSLIIPAHIWTPWYSVLGEKSGFDSIEECFRDLVGNVYAVETGLSSDPLMNREVALLNDFTLISNSDAHSPENIGRELTCFDINITFDNIIEAIKTGTEEAGFGGTIEFFPEEGKYFLDGHRKCNNYSLPLISDQYHCICTVCGKKMTSGVLNRIKKLSCTELQKKDFRQQKFKRITPLFSVLSQIADVSPKSKRVVAEYENCVRTLGSEMDILVTSPVENMQRSSPEIAKFIENMRNGNVTIKPGYDGKFGTISINLF